MEELNNVQGRAWEDVDVSRIRRAEGNPLTKFRSTDQPISRVSLTYLWMWYAHARRSNLLRLVFDFWRPLVVHSRMYDDQYRVAAHARVLVMNMQPVLCALRSSREIPSHAKFTRDGPGSSTFDD